MGGNLSLKIPIFTTALHIFFEGSHPVWLAARCLPPIASSLQRCPSGTAQRAIPTTAGQAGWSEGDESRRPGGISWVNLYKMTKKRGSTEEKYGEEWWLLNNFGVDLEKIMVIWCDLMGDCKHLLHPIREDSWRRTMAISGTDDWMYLPFVMPISKGAYVRGYPQNMALYHIQRTYIYIYIYSVCIYKYIYRLYINIYTHDYLHIPSGSLRPIEIELSSMIGCLSEPWFAG